MTLFYVGVTESLIQLINEENSQKKVACFAPE